MKRERWDRLERWLAEQSRGARLFLYLLAFLAVVAVGWYLWLSSQYDRYLQQSGRISKLQKELKLYHPKRYRLRRNDLNRSLPQLDRRISLTQRRIEKIEKEARRYRYLWFDNRQFIALLEATLRRSLDLGLRIDRIVKSVPATKTVPRSREEKKTLPTKKAPRVLLEKKVTIRGGGDFEDIIRLVYFIESFNLLLQTDSLTIRRDKEGRGNSFALELKFYGLVKP